MSEKKEQNDALVDLSALPQALVYRNNTGQAWQGRRVKAPVGSTVTIEPGTVVLRMARPISFGLVGSGDITGTIDGAAVMVEMKSATGDQRTGQEKFEAAWKRAGGIYVLARTAEEAVRLVRDALARRKAS